MSHKIQNMIVVIIFGVILGFILYPVFVGKSMMKAVPEKSFRMKVIGSEKDTSDSGICDPDPSYNIFHE